jgi:Holliday junction resolvase-like predicted endonuclease
MNIGTIRERILELLSGGTELDDDEIAGRLGVLRQQVNKRCRQMDLDGLVVRESGSRGKIVNRIVAAQFATPARMESAPVASHVLTGDWFWEGNVQNKVLEHLRPMGWEIIRSSDTASQERGIDILAKREAVTLAVEVKGYPSHVYQRGTNKGLPKRTQPTLQAKHWFSDALLKALRTKAKYPDWQVALALPDFRRYLSLLRDIASSLQLLGIDVFLVNEAGQVQEWSPANVPSERGNQVG